MKKLDWYILKRYLVTFLFTLLILIPIAVAIDISQRIDKFLSHSDLSVGQIIDEYYKNFIIYYANTFMPLALFIAVILFTSKLSNNTEIVAMTNARISFTRFLYPYIIGATLVVMVSLAMNHFVVPNSSKERKQFEKEFFNQKRWKDNVVENFSLQLNDSTYMYIKSYNFKSSQGSYFSIENYKGIELVQKLTSDNIRWSKKDSSFRLTRYKLRKVYNNFSTEDAQRIKDIEKVTNHDVKAVEYFIKEKFDLLGLEKYKEFIHFGLTSQDINNTAIPLSIKDAINDVYLVELSAVLKRLKELSIDWACLLYTSPSPRD